MTSEDILNWTIQSFSELPATFLEQVKYEKHEDGGELPVQFYSKSSIHLVHYEGDRFITLDQCLKEKVQIGYLLSKSALAGQQVTSGRVCINDLKIGPSYESDIVFELHLSTGKLLSGRVLGGLRSDCKGPG